MHVVGNFPTRHTSYQMAVVANQLEMVKHMTAIDPNVNNQLEHYHRESVLHLTTDPDVVTYLLACKPTLIDTVDLLANTVFHSHVQMNSARLPNYVHTLQILLEKKPMLLRMKNADGFLALQIASRYYLGHVIETCLRFDPALRYYEGFDNCGNTVLHLIAKQEKITDMNLIARITTMRQSELWVQNHDYKTPLDLAIEKQNTHITNQYRLHCSLEDIIASYHKYSPTKGIGAWALEPCAMLQNYLLYDLVFLVLSYLGIHANRKKKTLKSNVEIKYICCKR